MSKPSKPILLVDFDGVLHSYTSGWKGADVIPDPPVPGALKWLWAASDHFDVHIYSSRSSQSGGIEAMMDWFDKWVIVEWPSPDMQEEFLVSLTFPRQKPAAFLTIDDRALTFDGTWPSIDTLKNFKPWNKK